MLTRAKLLELGAYNLPMLEEEEELEVQLGRRLNLKDPADRALLKAHLLKDAATK